MGGLVYQVPLIDDIQLVERHASPPPLQGGVRFDCSQGVGLPLRGRPNLGLDSCALSGHS